MNRTENAPLELSLRVRPEWQHAAALRAAVSALVRMALADEEAATSAGMVACELAENAIKYGDWSRGDTFDVRLIVQNRSAALEVASPCNPGSRALDNLRGILRDVDETSAKTAYLKRVAEVAELANERGRLGLLRIAHELGSQITAEVQDGRLSVRAHWTLEDKGQRDGSSPR